MTYQKHFYAKSRPALIETLLCVKLLESESQDFSIFLRPTILKSQAEHGSDITRRFAMNRVGRMYAAAMQDRSIRLFMADDGKEMQKIQDEFLCTSLAFSPNGDTLASGSVERVVKLWDIRSGECLATMEGHEYPVLSLSFSPDGNRLVSGSGDTSLIIWDLDSRTKQHQMKGHGFYVVTCDWDPNDNRIVSGSVDANICEWNSNTGDMIKRHSEHRAAVHQVRFGPDGSRLASGSSDNHIVIWDSAQSPMRMGQVLQGHSSEVRALTFSEDGKYLASGSSDKVLYLWDTETFTIRGEATAIGEIDGIEWYPKAQTFITADGTGAIIRWDVTDLERTLAPFENILKEIEAELTPENRHIYVQKFEELCSQHDDETLQTKKIFYIVWQCKRALGLLKGKPKQ